MFSLISIISLFENIVCEYILVISSKKENEWIESNKTNQANHLPIYFGFWAVGRVIGTFFGGRIIENYGN